MKAYLLYEAGPDAALVLTDIEKPQLQPGEVLIKVNAIGINPVDAMIKKLPDLLTSLMGPERPVILGWDIAGEIAGKSADVVGFNLGDAVITLSNGKGYAEYVAVPASTLARKPGNISFEEAAGIPIAGLTAWQPLVNMMQIRKGDKVLVHAGAGGVGHYGIQIAKHLGAVVITTASARNRDFVLSLGANRHIDYTAVQFDEVVGEVDFVLDTVGGETLMKSIGVVKPGGVVVSVTPPITEAHEQQARERGVTLKLSMTHDVENDLPRFADLVAKGIIRTQVAAVYPFNLMTAAHDEVEKRRTVGKVIVKL